jgi:hypothetical protein
MTPDKFLSRLRRLCDKHRWWDGNLASYNSPDTIGRLKVVEDIERLIQEYDESNKEKTE